MNSDEYERLLKKIAEVQSDVTKQNAKYEALEAQYNLLRGQFNRKLAGIRKEELPEGVVDTKKPEEPTQSKDLNITPGIIPMKW